jgi:hypothetical protein
MEEEEIKEQSIEIKNKTDFKAQGKKNRQKGALFEIKVREDLQKMDWIVTKWMNTVDFSKDSKGQLVPAKKKFNPFLKALAMGTGFPDFICFRSSTSSDKEVIGVEVKSNGSLDQIEKGICRWLLDNHILSRILIARKKQEGKKIIIEYINFLDKYKKDFPAQ